jgi:crossover junction endodeoxyribonuclease RuvC
MIVLGVDPGLAHTGYGIVLAVRNKFTLIDAGEITTSSSLPAGKRLEKIYAELIKIIQKNKPDQAGVESLYFAKNSSSAIPVAQARGVVLLALTQCGVVTSEYPPQAIKQAIVGNGKAEKRQVQQLLQLLLGLQTTPTPDHAADALAAAVCHFNSSQVNVKHV